MSASQAHGSTLRQFAFYDVSTVKDARDLGSTPEVFKSPNEVSCVAASQGIVLVADTHGAIAQLTPLFEISRSWVAHSSGRITHLCFAEKKGIVVSLGEDASIRFPILKIWDLRHRDQKTGDPLLLISQTVSAGTSPHPASVLALLPSLSHVAVGLTDGSVLLLRHVDQAVASAAAEKTTSTSAVKARQIFTSADPVTGLGFRITHDGPKPLVTLFIVTTAKVLSFPCQGKSTQATVIDDVGAALHCTTITNTHLLVTVREEAIYTFGIEGREACLAYEGPKSSVSAWRSSLVIASPPVLSSTSGSRSRLPPSDTARVALVDLGLNIVTHSSAIESGVREVFIEYGNVFVLANDGILFKLTEKSTHAKLDMLYSRNLFLLATSLATAEGCSDAEVAEIKQRYGDHLYAKGDFDGAMAQFLQTVGYLQPSYVIRKFLDAQRIHNLLSYLEELHNRKIANAAHTGLLLNCIAKLGDTERLDTFVQEATALKSEPGTEALFDLSTAIRVMRQAGFSKHALTLAKAFSDHESVLSIQLEDLGEWSEALFYLRKMGVEAADDNLKRHGQNLLKHAPRETTAFLIDLCCGSLDRDAEESGATAMSRTPYLSYLSLGSKESGTADTPVAAPQILETPDNGPSRHIGSQAIGTGDGLRPTAVQYVPPSPRALYAYFADNTAEFVTFLEAVAERRYGQRLDATGPPAVPALSSASPEEDAKAEQESIWNTLLELYLGQGETTKAVRVLQSPYARLPYDPHQALIVCTLENFTAGIVLLYQRLGLQDEIVRFWIERDEAARAIEALKKYGNGRPELYKAVLCYLVAEPARLNKHSQNVTEMLETIESDRILHPIEATQILGQTSAASIGLLKEYLKRRITVEKEEIESDRALIASYRAETTKKQKEIADFKDPKTPRIFQVTRCSYCGGQLDLPAIHFMCRHSYHQRCLGENEAECPNCARAHGTVREIMRANRHFAEHPDLFYAELEDSDDGFATIAGAFSKGLLSVPQEHV